MEPRRRLGRRRAMRVVLVTAILGLVAACAGGGTTSDPTPATTPPVACTEIGCNSGLQVDLATVDLVADAAYLVELCIGSDCVEVEAGPGHTGEITPGADLGTLEGGSMIVDREADIIQLMVGFAEFDSVETVSFSITDVATGEVLAVTDGEEVPFERHQPNGPGCPPVCFFGRLSL